MTEIEQKRDALELAVLLRSDSNAVGRDIFIRSLEGMLAEFVSELLSDIDDGRALHVRAKALGLVETLTKMGVDIATVMQKNGPVRRSIHERVSQSLGT